MSSKYMQLVKPPPRDWINSGFSPARHNTMMALLGRPGQMSRDCTDPTGDKVKRLVVKQQITPHFKARGISPAIASLQMVMDDVKQHEPELYELIGTEGMLCCRAVRGSSTHFSNHSWGCAIDLTIGGILAPQNATKIPYGLIALYFYFHKRGWFWAQGYAPPSKTDPMHFEIAEQTMRRWAIEKLI